MSRVKRMDQIKENVMTKDNVQIEDDGPQGELPEVDVSNIPVTVEDDAISLAEESGESARNTVKIMGTRKVLGGEATSFKREPNLTGAGAVRCRIFFSRIAVAPLQYMEGQINAWLDANQIEIKAVTQVVGVMEGKTPEPNVIITVWY